MERSLHNDRVLAQLYKMTYGRQADSDIERTRAPPGDCTFDLF